MGYRVLRARAHEEDGGASFLFHWITSAGEMEYSIQIVWGYLRLLFYMFLPVIVVKFTVGYGNSGAIPLIIAVCITKGIGILLGDSETIKRETVSSLTFILGLSSAICSSFAVVWKIAFAYKPILLYDNLLSYFVPSVALLIWSAILYVIETLLQKE